ncbi:helix-turn-helix domain-containing protein [Paenibacillus lycopersici]|uniref:Helix-turn-helix domain-containing protein n=1 Tax=Paenibacillus lycopersici TaxID=2704462 RepID=A0A6C0FTS9_9BACL|nr:helix-turn-helix domain-containing protein [Paenibacillus lycopersici]QHT58753.1 helix-turn-helix domain-containing protein [Paenibacillus lycopersici]
MDGLWLKLRMVEEIGPGEWSHPLGYLPSHLLLLAVAGEARLTLDGRLLQLRPGHALVCLPGQLMQSDPNGRSELAVFRFDVVDETGNDGRPRLTEGDSPFPLAGEVRFSDAGEAIRLCELALRNWRNGDAPGKLRAEAAFYGLLGLMQEAAGRVQEAADAALNRTKAYMERHFDRNLTIDELAKLAGLSRYYYMRLFKACYGVSVMEYLTELRIDQAKRLLEEAKPTMRELARQVGYHDEFYFIRKFKQQVGIPPATYIRNRQRRIAAYSFPNIGQLLALQIVPAIAPMDHGWTDQYRCKYRTDVVTTLSHEYEFNFAALRAARPDYIIGVDAFLPPEEQERLREIAPSLFIPWQGEEWRSHLHLVSEFLGMPEEAKSWLRRYDHLAARTREQTERLVGGDTVLVAHCGKDGCYVYGRQTIAGVLYEDLGIVQPDRAAGIRRREEVPVRELASFEADRILLMLSDNEDVQAAWERFSGSEEWKRHCASLSSRVTPIPTWPWFDYSAYTQEKFLRAVPAIFGTA